MRITKTSARRANIVLGVKETKLWESQYSDGNDFRSEVRAKAKSLGVARVGIQACAKAGGWTADELIFDAESLNS